MNNLYDKINELQKQLKKEIELLNKSDNFDFYSDYLIKNQNTKRVPDLIKVGNLISEKFNYPALLPISKIKGLAFELNDTNREEINLTIENIALQIYNQMNSDYFNFTLIDPKNLGGNFQNLRRLNKETIGNIIFDEDEIRNSIKYHYNQSVKVINECLIHYSSIEDYNNKTGEKQPFRFLFIADFPYGFKDSLDKLNTILHNNLEAGVFIFMTYDKSIDIGTHQPKVQEIIDQMTRLHEFGNPVNDYYKIENIQNSAFYNNNFTIKLDRSDINPDKLKYSVEDILAENKQEINFSPSDGLRIPIGKVAGRTHYFTIGYETDNYHGIIGGQPGKGKTVLLNNIIARGIESYSDDELSFILMDCAGVGFQEFINSKYIHTLISSSNVEECVEGVKQLENELTLRENLFREQKVQELKDYNKVATNKLPRIICLIDEFHVLFTGSSRTSSYIETFLVEKIIKIGRKFGIHLIVSTQSLGGGVRRSILDNIPLRIALGMTADQSANFLGFKNEAAANLERGVAVYNNENGSLKANKTVKINYISSVDIENIVNNSKIKVDNLKELNLN